MSESRLDQVLELLYDEAALADASAYDEWLGLWDAECCYWVPCNEEDYDPALHVSIIYDDRARLEERCFRLSSEGVHSQEPKSTSVRLVGNVRIDTSRTVDDLIYASSRTILVELRKGHKVTYAAKCEYVLRQSADGLKLKEKKVVLLDRDQPLGNMTFLI